MVDLHTHILPEMDDGAENVLDSLSLLKLEAEQGINKIVFTPHFNVENIGLDQFLKNRELSLLALNRTFSAKNNIINIDQKAAAEVYLSPSLLNIDLKKLCIADTNYMLVELPSDYWRTWVPTVLDNLLQENIVPIVAHIERYTYFHDNFDALMRTVDTGALTQVNASSIVKHRSLRSLIFSFIKHNLVYCVASDTHSLIRRPPMLKEAYQLIERKFSKLTVEGFTNNARNIFDGKEIDEYIPSKPKKVLGHIF